MSNFPFDDNEERPECHYCGDPADGMDDNWKYTCYNCLPEAGEEE
tara:strand:+ start:4763 stop:4897 length:135 start_codon:yes stop_codon:yes gene_type:complete